jgi:hypothetical protein
MGIYAKTVLETKSFQNVRCWNLNVNTYPSQYLKILCSSLQGLDEQPSVVLQLEWNERRRTVKLLNHYRFWWSFLYTQLKKVTHVPVNQPITQAIEAVSNSSAMIRWDRCLEADVCGKHAQYLKYLTTLFQLNRSNEMDMWPFWKHAVMAYMGLKIRARTIWTITWNYSGNWKKKTLSWQSIISRDWNQIFPY